MKTRRQREHKIVSKMIDLYCHQEHGANDGLCADCQSLSSYAEQRLAHCPYGETKPACSNCPIHCYSTQQRAKIRTVMRKIGPRMIWVHPILAVQHLIDQHLRTVNVLAISVKRKEKHDTL